MKKPENCYIQYCGYQSPQSPEELEFEILGLETAIYEIKKRIATLKQSNFLVSIILKEENDQSYSQKS